MKKTAIILIGGLLISGVVFILLTQKSKKPTSNNLLSPTITISPQVQLNIYANDSGFSFKYPKSFILSEKKTDDESIYAWVELTNPKNKDVISIKLGDSYLTKIDDWFTASNKKSVKSEIKKIKFSDLDGRQFTNQENQITTLALDQGGVLISIVSNTSSVNQQIVSSFIFTQSAQTTTDTSNASNDGGGDIIFEGEEVVQ